jgi:hypothetical protein
MVMMTTTIMTMIPTPMHCIDISIANVVGANFLFLLMATRETATAVMTTTMTKMTTTTMTMTTAMMMTMTMMTTFPKLPYHLWLQVVTPPLLLVAPFMEMILIGPASCNSNPFQPSSNRNAFGCSDDTDVMLLSRTNNSLQQCISSSDSSSLIGLRRNPERNARAKANSYKVGNDSSEVGNDCFICSSDESASVHGGDPSIPMPNSLKPSPRLSFEVSNVLLSNGHAMTTGPVVNLHLGSPQRGDVSRRGSTAKRIGTRSSTMAVKAL